MNEKDPSGKTTAIASTVTALLVVGFVLQPAPAAGEDTPPRVSGRVLGDERPVSSANVYAYDVATYALEKVLTDPKGQFLFEALPAGLYKIVAHKKGFVPAVEMLLRRSSELEQFVELRLEAEQSGEVRQAESYWETRARIPADVLQQIRQLGLEGRRPEAALEVAQAFEARMAAEGGVAQLGDGYGSAQLRETTVAIAGNLGETRVGLDGRLKELAATEEGSPLADGEVRSLALSLVRPDESRVSVSTSAADGVEVRGAESVEVDLEHFRVGWSGEAAGGSSEVSAQLTEESNYYNAGLGGAGRQGGLDLPEASRTFNIEGTYSRNLSQTTSIATGMSFLQREAYRQDVGYRLLNPDGSLRDATSKNERIAVYGLAESQIRPRVLVEYGVYSTLREGELSLMPHGGMVVDLGADWQARTSFGKRLESPEASETAPAFSRFNAAFYSDQDTCRQIGEACYEVTFTHGEEGHDNLSVGAIHREFSETLRLYFSDDFFNRLESLFVVPGDEIPELQFRLVRQVSPKVLAKLESNIASGGGGIFYATDSQAYENEVRYLVTSLDTRFQSTSTGVFLAFHHLEQSLSPVAGQNEGQTAGISELEVQRLQLMLTQDLSALANIAPSLAVRFNMELSRGATPFQLTDDELHKKVTGGISLAF